MTSETQVQSRRAIEALRAGVPNQDAVRALGSSQPSLELKFRQQLKTAVEDFSQGKQASGMLVTGGFGSGKSHLLERFQHLAIDENFVCSKVVISKETPLYDLTKLYRTAVESAAIPGRRGSAMYNITSGIRFDSPAYADFYKWVSKSQLSPQFAATVYIYEYGKGDDEIRDRVIRFWSGDPIGVTELRRCLKELGEAASYKISTVPVKELALQRYFFTPQLIVAAGYSGWVLLIDEVELIGHYSLKQRARSYAELARWLGRLEGFGFPGLTCVLTITDDFEAAVLDDRNDEEKIPAKFRGDGYQADALLARQAEKGMDLIRRDKTRLAEPDSGTLLETFQKLRSVYAAAYGWEPPADWGELDLTHRTMRQHVRRWITEWDLRRLYPGYKPDIEIGVLRQDYTENPDLESPSEDSSEDKESLT